MSVIEQIIDPDYLPAEALTQQLPAPGRHLVGKRVCIKHPDRPFDGYEGVIIAADWGIDVYERGVPIVNVEFPADNRPVYVDEDGEYPPIEIKHVVVSYSNDRIILLEAPNGDPL